MSTPPEQVIRSYLEEQGGETDAVVRHLLTSFGVHERDEAGRSRIMDALRSAYVECDRPLANLDPDAEVHLTIRQAAPVKPPPWQPNLETAPQDAAPTAVVRTDSPVARRPNGRTLGVAAVIVVLAVAGGVGGYFTGRSNGEDLDATRAAGERMGQREGAARGTRVGYRTGLRRGRRAGYQQTYGKSYRRAYKAEFKKAGIAPPKKVNVP